MNELDLFTEALSRTDPAERATFLDQACEGNPDLRRRLEELLAGQAREGSPLDRPPVAPAGFGATVDLPTAIATGEHRPDGATQAFSLPDPDATSARESASPAPRAAKVPTSEGIGTVIAGRYTLVELIGEGGMGSVYLASQAEPVKRQVALKLIKTGMDSRSVLARFDAERQALALMDHPNIARIYDGGLTPAGQPYFVMELVKGVPLTEYCDQKRLSVQARLELFVAVCQAVQHAHQKGIIHRDLKPGNVLVTEVDGRPTPKVIDFGVAKATEVKLTDMSLADVGAIVGTPAYMSPEQAEPSSMDIDTRTDVYALGVMLYELLTGSPPIDASQFQRGAILEMLRMVREVDPPRPSTRLSTAEALPNIAANRSIEPARLSKLFQGELDWVVMKALEKDRDRRYDTANGFARDIQRYLADEVVEARPPSRGYRLKKFVKRNKIQVIAASLIFFVLVAGIAGTSWGLFEANRSATAERAAKLDAQTKERLAVEAAAREVAARLEEERQRKFAEAINRFVQEDFLALTSVEGQGRFLGHDEAGLSKDTTLGQLLDRAAEKLRARKDLDPRIEAELCWTVGTNYRGAGNASKGVPFLERCVELRRRVLGPDHEDTLDAQNSLAVAYCAAGRLDLALPLHEQTLSLQKAKLGPEHFFTLASMANLAWAYKAAGKLDLALPLQEQTLALMKAKLGPDHPYTLSSMSLLADAYYDAGKLDLALPLQEQTLALRRAKLGPEHPHTLLSMSNLAVTYTAAGKLGLALPLCEETLALRKAKLGPEHPDTLTSMNKLAAAYFAAGKLDLALPLFDQSLALRKAKLGPEHPDTLNSMSDLASGYLVAGKLDLALPLYVDTLALMKAKLGPEHPYTLTCMGNLAKCYSSLKRLDKSVPLFEELLLLTEKKFGRQHPNTQMRLAILGVNYKDAGQLKEAIPLLEEAHQSANSLPAHRWVLNQLIDAYMKAGENAKLADLLREQLPAARKSLPKDSPELASQLATIGLGLLQQKQCPEAEPLLRESLAIREKTHPDLWTTFNTKSLLGGALLGQKKYAEAEPLILAGFEGMKQREKTIPEQAGARLPEAVDRLIELFTATNQPDEVKKWQAERAKYPEAVPPPGEKK